MDSTSWRGGASSPESVEAGEERILFEQDDARARLDRAQPAVRLDLVRDQAKQRGLARTVAPDQRQPVARADEEVKILE